ncbi:Indoleamine 2,3-dioxygenase [Neolecta irregularis DAH-3]|uniref:Indoleamine 2,3-dioxygenase n=1 Tax=Neolecta irregularis (strain DAH-3) TaxID=1198029 RepID=A0A1U7LQL2_NEOID|nr:Indoleamine 2,3-dioxygenase [Neolecta irregularis DAH-3]|eukprot:OLL24918.1 Indoleamine 2,3-dioxygenase [Neolecta irregularis DAH-3]
MVAASIPVLENYGLYSNGFLPASPPLARLINSYYDPWESVMSKFNALLLARRLQGVIEELPVLSTQCLVTLPERQRAFMLLGFLAHGYIWGRPEALDTLPACIAKPWDEIAQLLGMRPVICEAAVCLWNYRSLFENEPLNLDNLATLHTFTGSLDESWFYLVTTSIEAQGGPILPLILSAMSAAQNDDPVAFVQNLCQIATILDSLNDTLASMYERCDPRIFYHRVRPYLAGWNNMAEAGLPEGVVYQGCGDERPRTYAGGSAAQSPLIHALDIALSVKHRPFGVVNKKAGQSSKKNFILSMRDYMYGPHRLFLQDLESAANIRQYVLEHQNNHDITAAYDACLAMIQAFRNKHIQIVTQYIVNQSQAARNNDEENIPPTFRPPVINGIAKTQGAVNVKGTGGTFLIPFLRQSRDETGENAVGSWARHLILSRFPGRVRNPDEEISQDMRGLASVWSEGAICIV